MLNNKITYCRASTDEELNQILKLQKLNLPDSLSVSEKENEGFLTVVHTIEILKRMNDCCAHIIAKHKNKVVGYTLCMHHKFANDIEILKPLFIEINKGLSDSLDYIIMGQVCIDKKYRKKGIFRGLYSFMKQELHKSFSRIITEVDAKNTRSLNAHKAIGFENLREYYANDKHWVILYLNCNTY